MNPRHRRQSFWFAVLMSVGVIASACVSVRSAGGEAAGSTDQPSPASTPVSPAGPTSPAGPASPNAATSPAASPPPPGPTGAPGSTAGSTSADVQSLLIGYISLDERLPFARSVTDSVRAAAERAGVDVVVCDSALTPQGALACGRALGQTGIDGLISFQGFPEIAADICLASGNVPTVGVAFEQGPCEVARVQLDQAESGRIAGDAMGRFASDEWDCDIDAYISLEASAAGADAAARMAGYREGFKRHCRIRKKLDFALDGADRVATAENKVARALRRAKGRHVVVVGLNEDAILGAIEAATAAGRSSDLWYSGQGADPSIRQTIACDPQYVASVAHFPERYGSLLVPALLAALAGEQVAPVIDAPLELMRADDVRRVYPDTAPCDE